MGGRIKSISFAKLFDAIRNVFEAVAPANLRIASKQVSLAEIEKVWGLPGESRAVLTIP
jgi:hypothetical protein